MTTNLNRWTSHALSRALSRGIAPEDVLRVLDHGQAREDPGGGLLWNDPAHPTPRLRNLVVAATHSGTVKTVFWLWEDNQKFHTAWIRCGLPLWRDPPLPIPRWNPFGTPTTAAEVWEQCPILQDWRKALATLFPACSFETLLAEPGLEVHLSTGDLLKIPDEADIPTLFRSYSPEIKVLRYRKS